MMTMEAYNGIQSIVVPIMYLSTGHKKCGLLAKKNTKRKKGERERKTKQQKNVNLGQQFTGSLAFLVLDINSCITCFDNIKHLHLPLRSSKMKRGVSL